MLLFLFACADLPEGWEDARPIEDFTQKQCEGSAYDTGFAPEVRAAEDDAGVAVEVDHAVWRCAQDVEGFWREGDAGVDVLVQPVDMNPTEVAGCDCRYDVSMVVPAEVQSVTVFTRGDHQSGRDEPAELGTAELP